MHHLNKLLSKNLVEGLPTLKLRKIEYVMHVRRGNKLKMFSNLKILFPLLDTLSIGGNYYGLVIFDDYSRFTWTLFIVSKDHAFIAFKHLGKILENENNCYISFIKFDHGVSFKMKVLKNFVISMA